MQSKEEVTTPSKRSTRSYQYRAGENPARRKNSIIALIVTITITIINSVVVVVIAIEWVLRAKHACVTVVYADLFNPQNKPTEHNDHFINFTDKETEA